MKLGEVVVTHMYYNIKSGWKTKTFFNSPFFCSDFQSVSRIVKIAHSGSRIRQQKYWTGPSFLRLIYYLYSSGTLRSSRACWWASKMKSTTQLVCSVDSKARAWKNKKKKYNIFYIMFTQYCRENPSALSPSVDLTFFKKKFPLWSLYF